MRAAGAVVLATMMLGATACSGDGEDADSASSTTATSTTSSASSSTTRSTRTFGPTTEPGPRPPTDARPADCTFQTALGSRTGKTFKGVTCKAAQEVWRRYLALPPDPAAGNSNHRELDDGWVCHAPTAGSAIAADEGGICERTAHRQKFVLHYQDR